MRIAAFTKSVAKSVDSENEPVIDLL